MTKRMTVAKAKKILESRLKMANEDATLQDEGYWMNYYDGFIAGLEYALKVLDLEKNTDKNMYF